jgi:uncharacterized membrane protein YsdA (DUF1294 family)/cold shock CspA family protein
VTKETGKLIRWDDEKGYGFIRPDNGGEDRFLHANSLTHFQRRPRENDRITYEDATDSQGRLNANNAKIAGGGWSLFTIIWFISIFVLAAYAACVFKKIIPFHPLSIYALMSILTVHQYSKDKSAAKSKKWRTSEFKLHFFELAGGWPGALFAQHFYRHKSRKMRYQITFWLIVLLHGVSWALMISQPDALNQCKTIIVSDIKALLLENRPRPPSRALEERPMPQPMKVNYVAPRAPEFRVPITVKNNRRVVNGIITEVNPRVGICVTLPPDIEGHGIIDKATLNPGFTNQFQTGKAVQVSIKSISMKGSEKRIELELAAQ